VAVYKQKNSFAYITGSRVTALLRKAVKKVYPDISKDDLKKFSAHSFRVWACVLLDEAGKSPDFIKNDYDGLEIHIGFISVTLVLYKTSIVRLLHQPL
jgi:hypothetical protein